MDITSSKFWDGGPETPCFVGQSAAFGQNHQRFVFGQRCKTCGFPYPAISVNQAEIVVSVLSRVVVSFMLMARSDRMGFFAYLARLLHMVDSIALARSESLVFSPLVAHLALGALILLVPRGIRPR
jgi:hypothetical protein